MRNFADAYQILKREKEIPAGFRVLLVQLSNADDDIRFWNTLERILNLLDRPGNTPNLQGEVLVDCAYCVAKRRNYNRSEKLLAGARIKFLGFANSHNAAIAAWMRGAILWQLPDSHDAAIKSWLESIDLLGRMLTNGPFSVTYEQRQIIENHTREMATQMERAVLTDDFELVLA